MHRYARTVTLTAVLSLHLLACRSTSPYQGLTPEQIFAVAQQRYEEGDYDNAIEALDRLLVTFGNWPQLPEARLLLGHAYFGNEEFLTARTEYNRFLDRYPGHPSAPAAALGGCRSLAHLSPNAQRDQGFTQDAGATCRNVALDYRGTEEANEAARVANEMRLKLAEAEYERGVFYARRDLWDSAIRYYEFVVDLYPETEFAPRALLGMCRANEAIGYDDLAESARQRLLDEYPESPEARQLGDNGTCEA